MTPDVLDEMIDSAVERALEPFCWRPIETAPKDGLRLLLFRDGGQFGPTIHIGAWRLQWSDMLRCEVERWWIGQNLPFDHPPPTHWLPLPEPP